VQNSEIQNWPPFNSWILTRSQVKYIYIALFTIQIVSKLLHSINQHNVTLFVYYWKKKTSNFGRADQWYDGSFNLNIPNWASQRQQWQGFNYLIISSVNYFFEFSFQGNITHITDYIHRSGITLTTDSCLKWMTLIVSSARHL